MKPAQGRATSHPEPHFEAAGWLMRLREPEKMTSDELKSWKRFIADPENREAFEAMQRAASLAPTLTLSQPSVAADEDTYDGSMPVRLWRIAQGLQPPHTARKPVWLLRSAVAVACALLASIVAWLAPSWYTSGAQAYRTQGAQHREVVLDDGSRITLGAKTSVEVRYTPERRLIYLEHGVALFTVAHDRDRPFVVFAGTGSVTALGTEFNIWRDLDRTKVTVTEGVVEVAPVSISRPASPAAAWPDHGERVKKGQEITYTEDVLSSRVQTADLSAATAWREGRLVYRRTPLKYVISDVNRYFRQQLVLEDTHAGELEFTGAVPQNLSAMDFVRALEKVFRIEVVKIDNDRIVIRSLGPVESELPLVKS
jgi:transmembrane sensor